MPASPMPVKPRGAPTRTERGTRVHRRHHFAATLPDVSRRPAYRLPEPVALTSGFRRRAVILVPRRTTRDWRLFTAATDGAVRTLDEKGGSLLDLQATVQREADKWGLIATMRLSDGPDGATEFEVSGF